MASADCDATELACRAGWVCFDWNFVVFWATKPARWPRVKTSYQPLERHNKQKPRASWLQRDGFKEVFLMGNIAVEIG